LTDSTLTIVVALVADLGLAIAKLAAGLVSSSSSMLAEGAHRITDTPSALP
jgi:divalent metal cation (Fe/Co/Zn/Cd) transporter